MHGNFDPEDGAVWPWPSAMAAPAAADDSGPGPADPAPVGGSPVDADPHAEVSSATDDDPLELPTGWTDSVTGADGPRLWDRFILSEGARVRRYRRPVTVALAEIDGLDGLAHQWGWEIAIRAFAACARVLAAEIRSSDHLARVDRARFGVLLTETAEIAAINFIERARTSCEAELRQYGDVVAVRFGWASPPPNGDLADAVELARERLEGERVVDP
jgi:diguanylate cyclase (GGDEF)-like protein